jgi:hypothetical protein
LKAVAVAVDSEALADRLGSQVLPDDGVIVGLSRMAVPNHGRLALVGHTDGRELGTADFGLRQSAFNRFKGAVANLERVVLDPLGARKYLTMLELALTDDFGFSVEDDKTGAGGTLVNSAYVGFFAQIHMVILVYR